MSSKGTAAAVITVLFALALAGTFALGAGPSLFTGAASDAGGDFPTATPPPSGGADPGGGAGSSEGAESVDSSGDGGSPASAAERPFTFAVDEIDACGRTCRDVTSTLTNDQNHTAESVEVYVRIFVGNSTDEDDVIWRGNDTVGALDANESYTATERVRLSYAEGFAVTQNDGWITIQTTVVSDERTVTFTGRRDVI